MTVNGEPKLTCATFLARLRARARSASSRCGTFPSFAISSSISATSCASWCSVKPWLVRAAEKPLAEGEYLPDAGGAGRVQAVQHVHQLHAVLLRRARSTASIPSSSGRRRSRWRSDTTSTPATRARRSAWRCSPSTRGSGGARSSASARRSVPKHVDPAGAIQRYKLTRRRGIDEDVLHAAGARDERASTLYTAYHPRWLRRPMSTYWWLGKWSLFRFILRECSCMFVAWFVVYLLMVIDAVGQGSRSLPARFMEWSASAPVLAMNVVAFLFIVFHAVTFFEAAPQALVVHVGQQARARTPGVGGSLCRMGWRPRRSSAWLLWVTEIAR